MAGFPDWQKIVSWVGPSLFDLDTARTFNADTAIVPPTPLSSFARLLVAIDTLDQDTVVTMIGRSTPSSPRTLSNRQVWCPKNMSTSFVLGVNAAVAEVDIHATAYPCHGNIGVWPTLLPEGAYSEVADAGLVYQWPVAALGAGLQDVFDLPAYYGRARLAVLATTQPVTVQIAQHDATGAQVGVSFGEIVDAGQWLDAAVYIPPNRSQVYVTNDGTAAADVYVSLTPELVMPA